MDTARQHLIERAARWLESAGVTLPRDRSGQVGIGLEIDPLMAIDAAELKDRLPGDLQVKEDTFLQAP